MRSFIAGLVWLLVAAHSNSAHGQSYIQRGDDDYRYYRYDPASGQFREYDAGGGIVDSVHSGASASPRPRRRATIGDPVLQQRRQVAERLRRRAEQTGNAPLREAADRIEQRSFEQDRRRRWRNRRQATWQSEPWGRSVRGSITDRSAPYHRQPSTQQRVTALEMRSNWRAESLAAEQRLNRQLETADRLRHAARRNRSDHLRSAAEQIELRATQRYEQDLNRIDRQRRQAGAGNRYGQQRRIDSVSSARSSRPGTPRSITRRNLQEQMRAEEQRLIRRLDRADRMRRAGRQRNNQQMIHRADQLEQLALEQYEQRLETLEVQPSPRDGFPSVRQDTPPDPGAPRTFTTPDRQQPQAERDRSESEDVLRDFLWEWIVR